MNSGEFSKELSESLLSSKWLVKLDSSASIPYLFKVSISDERSECSVLITDTKSVWAEILTPVHAVRRWRACNPNIPVSSREEALKCLRKLLQSAHSSSSVSDASFEVVESSDADLAFELDFGSFKWRWETYCLGPKTSSEVLSRHLILPLITLSHISFNSADPVNELEEGELEKVVDKTGKSARRSTDIHVRQTLGRPRIATSLQRISSLFGFSDALPSIEAELTEVDLSPQLDALKASNAGTEYSIHVASPKFFDPVSDDAKRHSPPPDSPVVEMKESSGTKQQDSPSPSRSESPKAAEKDSETDTESENDDAPPQTLKSQTQAASEMNIDVNAEATRNASAAPVAAESQAHSQSETSSAPSRKRKTPDSDSDSDSDGSKGRAGKSKTAPRGVRQPLRRLGKKF